VFIHPHYRNIVQSLYLFFILYLSMKSPCNELSLWYIHYSLTSWGKLYHELCHWTLKTSCFNVQVTVFSAMTPFKLVRGYQTFRRKILPPSSCLKFIARGVVTIYEGYVSVDHSDPWDEDVLPGNSSRGRQKSISVEFSFATVFCF